MIKKIKEASLISSLTKTKFTRRAFILWAGLGFAAVGSYLFYFILARMLSVEEYGLFYSLIALTYLFSVPHETIRTTVAKYTSLLWAEADRGKIKGLMLRSVKVVLTLSIFIFVAFLLLLPIWVRIWHTDIWTLIIISLSLIVSFILPVIWGILQGTNRFGHLGINNSVEMFVKLVTAVALVLLGLGVYGALIAIPLSLTIAFFAGLISLRDILKAKEKKFSFEKHIFRYSLSAFVIFLLFIALYSSDIILARHFLSPINAGLYSAISVIGKVVLFGSTGLTRAMFSEVVEKHGKQKTRKSRERSKKVLFKALSFLALLSGILIFLSFIFPELIINIVVGNRYIAATPLLRYIVLSMTFLSFSSLIIFYNLSIDWNKKLTAKILSVALFLQIALLILFHTTLEQFVKVILGINIGLFLALLITIKR